MGFRSNQPITARDFSFSSSGSDDLSGISVENPLLEPSVAIQRVNDLVPPPSPVNRASITAISSGTSTSGLVIPQGCSCYARIASITTTDPLMIEALGNQRLEWGSL
jgi:hypothetical protein